MGRDIERGKGRRIKAKSSQFTSRTVPQLTCPSCSSSSNWSTSPLLCKLPPWPHLFLCLPHLLKVPTMHPWPQSTSRYGLCFLALLLPLGPTPHLIAQSISCSFSHPCPRPLPGCPRTNHFSTATDSSCLSHPGQPPLRSQRVVFQSCGADP